jgi:hypothetical protein
MNRNLRHSDSPGHARAAAVRLAGVLLSLAAMFAAATFLVTPSHRAASPAPAMTITATAGGNTGFNTAVLGDVNGDGYLDAVGRSDVTGQGGVFINQRNGSHGVPPTFLATGQNLPLDTTNLASVVGQLGDIDGDGDLDIFAVPLPYFNDGTGNFTASPQAPLSGSGGFRPTMKLADLDGDGDLDAVTIARSSGPYVYQNNGSGVFTLVQTLSVTFPSGSIPDGWTNVTAVNFDGDGDLDLLLDNSRVWAPIVMLNNGSNHFTQSFAGVVGSSFNRAADMDGDGDIDIATGGATYFNDGLAHFTRVTGGTATGTMNTSIIRMFDLNYDGFPDAINSIWTDFGDGAGFLTSTNRVSYPTGTSAGWFDMGDIDNDGIPEIVRNAFNGQSNIDVVWFSGITPPSTNHAPNCSGATIANLNAAANCQATISGANVSGVSDPDNDVLTITVSPTTLQLGANSVTVTADDGRGGTCSTTVTVNVTDNTPPQITALPPNASYQCLSQVPAGNPAQATATDNCSTPTITVADASNGGAGSTASPLIITRVFFAKDAANNTSSATQTITVIDTTTPTLSAPGNVTVTLATGATTCGTVVSDATLGSATASDNCGAVNVTRSGVPAGNFFPVGTTTLSYTATDAAGNTVTAIQTVTVTSPDDYDGDGSADPCDSDDDNDGLPDASDAFPRGSLLSTVSIAGCNTSVPNHVLANGASFNDLIAQCAANAKNHGDFVSCVTALTNEWKSVGLITGAQKGAIMGCASAAATP